MKKCPVCSRQHDSATKLCEVCKEGRRRWKRDNPERVTAMRVAYAKKSREAGRRHHRKRRDAVLSLLGNRCSDPRCRWMNSDGSLGCAVRDMLQVDHINGGGCQEARLFRNIGGYLMLYRKILAGASGYQLLCANCNWRKKYENNELGSGKKFPAPPDCGRS
jgi:hypothetical protein